MQASPATDHQRPPARASRAGADTATGLGWALWSFVSAIPWLLPTHSAPWTTFYGEIAMALMWLPMAAWIVWSGRGRWRLDALDLGFFAAALVPLCQAAAGMFQFPAEAPLASLYLTGFGLTGLLARRAEQIAPGRLVESLFAGLAIAALVSTGLAAAQWLGIDTLGVLLAPNPMAERPVANVGQPNNLATLLVWGLVAIWWGCARGKIGGLGATLAAGFLLFGVTLTQSRAGVLEVALLAAAAYGGRRMLGTPGRWPVWLGLGAWFAACLVALRPATHLLLQETTRSLADAASPRERLMLGKLVLTAISEHPWLGYGWNQNVTAHVALAEQFPMHGTVGNAHNLVLDLIMWCGLPLAALFTTGLLLWFRKAWRQARTPQHGLMLLALATFLLHAMLELPHVFAGFLLPVAILMGTLSAGWPAGRAISVPRWAITLALAAHAALLVGIFDEYGRIETEATAARMRAAGIVGAPPEAQLNIVVLRSLQQGLVALRTQPTRGMPEAELALMRRAVTRYPTAPSLFRYAQGAAMNGRPQDAEWSLRVLCSLQLDATCRAAGAGWQQLIAGGDPELAAVRLPAASTAPAPKR